MEFSKQWYKKEEKNQNMYLYLLLNLLFKWILAALKNKHHTYLRGHIHLLDATKNALFLNIELSCIKSCLDLPFLDWLKK